MRNLGLIRSLLDTAYGRTTDDQEAVTNLLADVRHYCDAADLSFAECDREARQHYDDERAEGVA